MKKDRFLREIKESFLVFASMALMFYAFFGVFIIQPAVLKSRVLSLKSPSDIALGAAIIATFVCSYLLSLYIMGRMKQMQDENHAHG